MYIYTHASPTNKLKCIILLQFTMSLIKIMNKKGERIDCGVPKDDLPIPGFVNFSLTKVYKKLKFKCKRFVWCTPYTVMIQFT